jgi:hypothetical protein
VGAREWLGRGRSRPKWREYACVSAEVTWRGRANTGRQQEAEEQLHSVQDDDVQGGRAMREELQCGGCRRNRPGSSRAARRGHRRPLKRKQRLRSSGTADCAEDMEMAPVRAGFGSRGDRGGECGAAKRRRRSGLN